MAFFDNSGANEYQEELEKALSAGYGTNSADFEGGRAIIPEDCEQETLNILDMTKDDCKVMASLKTEKVRSTVHEKNLREDEGDFRHLTTTEGGDSEETDQQVKRKTFEMKYVQTKRGITRQMIESETFEGALASEKISGINTVLKSSEYQCFHGDSRVVPTEFDGFETQIRNAKKAHQNILDLRGATIGSYGEKVFDEISLKVFRNGGSLEKAYFPPVLAKDIKALFEDRIRFGVEDKQYSFGRILDYPTATGETIRLSGNDAGADKFYYAKGEVYAEGNAQKRPSTPSGFTATPVASASGSKFTGSDAGDYLYEVHAVNAAGYSEGKALSVAVAVASGAGVKLSITAASGNETTGYIICRSAKNGNRVMEMVRIPANENGTTEYTDLNEDLPGTASMILLTENKVQPIIKFGQLMPVCTIPLGKVKAKDEFLVATYGGLMVYAPKFCGLVSNIGYGGGLY